jgi:ATP-dependent Clp protease ATP-binding subunit ClpA
MIFSNYLMHALQEQVAGQEYAIAALTRAITLALSGWRRQQQPLAVLLFVGPTGAGKAHTARALAQVLLGNSRKLLMVNCPQLAQAADPFANLYEQLVVGEWLAQTTAAPPPVPFSLVLIEKIERATPAFRDYLAAALDRGALYARGSLFSLRNAFVILTSDLSRKQADQLIGRTIGFFQAGEEFETPRQHLLALEEMDQMLGAYLVNRIDEIILFESLTEQKTVFLLQQQLTEIEKFLAAFSLGLIIDGTAEIFLLKHSLEDLTHGLRQIRRVLRNYLEFPLADLLLSRQLTPGATILVKHEEAQPFLHFQVMVPRLAPRLLTALPNSTV